jgi:hypothetical protein
MPLTGVQNVSYGPLVVTRLTSRINPAHGGHEEILIRKRPRVESSLALYTTAMAVTAAANAVTAWRWLFRNPPNSGRTMMIRELHLISQHRANTLVTAVAPLHTIERWTSVGTATGGTELTPARVLSSKAPLGKLYFTNPSGVTNTRGAIAYQIFPSINFSTTAAQPRAHWPVDQVVKWNDTGLELVPGEALAMRQHEAGATSEATERYILTNMLVEEFTRPAV